MTKLDEIAKTAKHKAETKQRVALEEGEIRCYSDKQGFSWGSNADGQSIVRHTVNTIESALTTLDKKKGSELHKIMLATGIMKALDKVTKIEADHD